MQYILGVLLLFLMSCAQMRSKIEAPKKNEDLFRVSWIKNLDPVYNSGNLPIGTSSPFIFEDIVYMGDLRGSMNAFDINSGKLIWSASEGQAIQSRVNKVSEYIYYGSIDGRFYSRHYLTGKLNYAVDLGSPIESQPIYSSGRMIIHLRNHTIITLDAKTGKIFWRYQRSIPYTTTLQRVSEVYPLDNNIIVGFADGNLVSLSIEEGIINWEQKLSTGVKFVDVDVTPILFGKYLVAGSAAGPIRFVNTTNGLIEKTLEFTQSHTALIHNDELIVGSTDGIIYRIDQYGKIISQKQVSNEAISSIVKWKGALAVTTMGESIYLVDGEDFTEKAHFSLGSDQSAIFGTATVSGEYLSVYSSRNRLYLFK